MGHTPKITDDELARLICEVGPYEAAKRTGYSIRNVFKRREAIEIRRKHKLLVSSPRAKPRGHDHPGRIEVPFKNGHIFVGSDCHYWPGPPSLMHQAFVKLIKHFKPAIVVLNGDVIDAGTISRYPPIGWTKLPTVQEEIEVAQERLHEIEKAAGKAWKIWTLGNHDARFETRLATIAPEFAKVVGTRLTDHFPLWNPAWSVFVNDDVVIKHRHKGGIHAQHNSVLWAGRTTITGHLHSAKVIPFTDYNGTRYGVDSGCIADPSHRAFIDYTEDSPKNWRDAFAILTFRDGRLLPPQLVTRWGEDEVVYCNEVIAV